MSLGKNQELFAKMLGEFIGWLYANGYTVRIGEVWRPQEMQDLYLKTGKTKAKYSKHQDKVAADLHIFKDSKWFQTKEELKAIGAKWESMNKDNRWGGNFSFIDTPHYELNS